MVPNMRKNDKIFTFLTFLPSNNLYDLYWPFSIFMVFLMSFKAIDIKNCQIKAKSTFLEFLDKFCQKLP